MIDAITLLKMDRSRILSLDPKNLQRELSTKEIRHIFTVLGAFWNHPGDKNPEAPHALLTSGKHSDIYVNCPKVIQRTNLCQIMAYQILLILRKNYTGPIHWVTGSDSSALGLSKDVANLLNARWHPMQKVPGKEERQVWEKAIIASDETVLHVEELMVTSTTFRRVRRGITEAHDYPIHFVPFTPVLVLRPEKNKAFTNIGGGNLISPLYFETLVVDPAEKECPLCAKGSKAIKPKGKNWDVLVESMAA